MDWEGLRAVPDGLHCHIVREINMVIIRAIEGYLPDIALIFVQNYYNTYICKAYRGYVAQCLP